MQFDVKNAKSWRVLRISDRPGYYSNTMTLFQGRNFLLNQKSLAVTVFCAKLYRHVSV